MRNKKNSEGLTLMEWACAAGAYAAWLAGEDPTEWRNARSSDEAVMVKKRASLERLVGGPLEEDVKEFTGVNRRTSWLRNDLDVCAATDPTPPHDKGFLVYDDATTAVDPPPPTVAQLTVSRSDPKPWSVPRLPADTRRGFCPTFPDGGKRLFTIKPVPEPASPPPSTGFTPPSVGAYTVSVDGKGSTIGKCQESPGSVWVVSPIEINGTENFTLNYERGCAATIAEEVDSNFGKEDLKSATPTEPDPNLIPKFGEVWISKDRRRANYFTVRSVNLKDGEVHTSDHRTIKLSRMSRYRKLK